MEDRGNQQRTSASSFKHYGRLPTAIQRKVKTRRRNSPQRIEKINEFTLLHFDESNHAPFTSTYFNS